MAKVSVPKESLQKFCQHYQVRRLALFGSILRDDFRSDSDVDILVVFDPSARVTFLTLGRMKRELSALFNRNVDLVPQEGLKPAIREAVIASAEEVYAA
ncbi:MAG: nucleotidyltransferase family protein [Chloroflexota bacterium]